MTTSAAIVPIIIAVVLAFLAFRFVKGVIKFGAARGHHHRCFVVPGRSTHGMGLGGLR